MTDFTALWAISGVAVPQYVRARRAARRRPRIPPAVLKRYHQSDAWRARKTAYYRHHPKVCVACLWLMPVAFWGWYFRLFVSLALVWFPPLKRAVKRLIKRLFKRNSLATHHIRYPWDPELKILRPGAERNRDIMCLCTTIPLASRIFDGCSHHAAADRVRRFCERTGLSPVWTTRVWIAKCWGVQTAVFVLILRLWSAA
jgi:hypothetical protein